MVKIRIDDIFCFISNIFSAIHYLFTMGYYNAYKYKKRPKCARGGDVL